MPYGNASMDALSPASTSTDFSPRAGIGMCAELSTITGELVRTITSRTPWVPPPAPTAATL